MTGKLIGPDEDAADRMADKNFVAPHYAVGALFLPQLWRGFAGGGHSHRHQQARLGPTLILDISLGYPEEIPERTESDLLLRGLIDTTTPGLLVH